jgi:Peptidase M15/Type IV secretion system pilin
MKPLLLTLTLGLLFIGQITYAQEDKPTVGADGTLEAGDGFVPCSGTNCSACDFVVLGNTAIKWLIGISFLFFAILAVKAGVGLVISRGNPSALSQAKSSFQNAFIGLIIILVAWLLVDTIMRQLVKGNGTIEGYGPWSEVQCSVQNETQTVLSYEGDNEFVGATTVSGTEGGTSVRPVNEASMTSLRGAGVVVADWNGTQGPGRTDLVHPTVAAAVVRMQNLGKAANGGRPPFQITAAYTRNVGHSAGSQHYKGTAVDLQPVNGGSYDQIIQLCRQAGFTFINDERSANHIHCDMR